MEMKTQLEIKMLKINSRHKVTRAQSVQIYFPLTHSIGNLRVKPMKCRNEVKLKLFSSLV